MKINKTCFTNKAFLLSPLTGLLLLGFLVVAPNSAYSYTLDDINNAGGDATQIKKIVDDEASDVAVRTQALWSLPWPTIGTYFNSPFYLANPGIQGEVIRLAAKANILPLADHSNALRVGLGSGDLDYLLTVQTSYVRKLIEAKRSGEALLESRRLLGITPLQSNSLVESLSAVSIAIKADALSKDKSLSVAIGEANAYLEAVNKGDVKGQAYSALAYPATPGDISALAEDARVPVAMMALLYAGRYDEAEDKAKTLLEVAGNNEDLLRAVNYLGAALNGKAGLPTSANAILQPKQP